MVPSYVTDGGLAVKRWTAVEPGYGLQRRSNFDSNAGICVARAGSGVGVVSATRTK